MPEPSRIVWEDDRLVVTLERCDNDMFYVRTALRVAVRDPERHVLITDPGQAPDDPREAILLRPRQECVTNNLTSGLRSFDLAATDSASWRLYSQLELSVYHMCCLDVTAAHQADGSVLISTVGDVNAMQNRYDDGMVLLTALTLTDRSGEDGRVEIFYRDLPSAPRSLDSTTYRLADKLTGFALDKAVLYHHDGYAYLSIRFNLTDGLTTPDAVRLNAADYPAANGLEVPVASHLDEYFRWNLEGPSLISDPYLHAAFRLEGMPVDADLRYPRLTFLRGTESAFTVELVSQEVGRTYTPTPSPDVSPTPAPTDVPVIAPTGDFSIPTDAEVLSSYNLTVVQKVQKYSHYRAKLRAHAEGFVLQPYFRYHDPLPEGAMLRLTAINDQQITDVSALITPSDDKNSPAGCLTARLCLPTVPQARCTFYLEAIHPVTGGVIFTASLKTSAIVRVPTGGQSGGGSGSGSKPSTTTYRPPSYVTPYSYPLKDALEDGMQIRPPSHGFGW